MKKRIIWGILLIIIGIGILASYQINYGFENASFANFGFMPAIKGDGNLIEKTFTPTEENEIDKFFISLIIADHDLLIKTADTDSITVYADQNIISEIVESSTIIGSFGIKTTNQRLRLYPSKQMIITIPNTISSFEMNGAFDFEMNIDHNLTLLLNGASDGEIHLTDVENFHISLRGASEVKLSGTVTSLQFNISGAAEIEALELLASKVKVTSSGASSVTVNAIDLLDVNVSGAADIKYKGNPELIVKKSGSASVTSIQ